MSADRYLKPPENEVLVEELSNGVLVEELSKTVWPMGNSLDC